MAVVGAEEVVVHHLPEEVGVGEGALNKMMEAVAVAEAVVLQILHCETVEAGEAGVVAAAHRKTTRRVEAGPVGQTEPERGRLRQTARVAFAT
jgi:hypothetical protein